MLGFGRHRRYGRRRHLRGLGDPGMGEDLRDVAIGVAGGAAALAAWTLFLEQYLPTPIAKIATGGIAGVAAGTLLTRLNRPLRIGMGATMGAAAILGAAMLARARAAGVPGSAYEDSRRDGLPRPRPRGPPPG